MSALEKVLFLADYIEPRRSFPGVDEVRSIAKEDLDKAVLYALNNTIISLITRNQKVFPLTLHARNDLVDFISRKEKEDSI
jgi:HD superfamily phosphohydrolase YqeK